MTYSAYNQTSSSGNNNYASSSRNLGSANGNYPGMPPGRMVVNGNNQRNGSNGSAGPGLKPPGGERKGESRDVARVHWEALREFLATWLKEGESILKFPSRILC